MKLRIILLILSLIAFLSTLTGGYLYYSSMKNSAFEEAQRQAVSHTKIIKNHFAYFLSENLNSVRALAGLKELPDALLRKDGPSLAKVNAILDDFQHAYKVDVCYLMDREGNTIASSNRNAPDSFVGHNYSFRPYFKHAISGDPTLFRGYMALGTTSKRGGIYYSYPVYGSQRDKPIGVAVIKAPIDPMEREFNREYQGIVMLTDPHGIIFMSNRKEFVLHTFSKLSREETDQIKQSRQFGEGPWPWIGMTMINKNQVIDHLGNRYLFHKLNLENYPGWNLIYLSDMKSILNRVSQPLLQIIGYLVLTWCLFIGLAVFALYRKANIEIFQRKMAEEALRKAHAEMEKRVVERTADIAASINKLQKEITVRQSVEDALRESEGKYRTLTDNLSVGVFRTTPGPKGDYIEANSAYAAMFGFGEKDKLLSSHAYDLYQNPEDRERFSMKMLKDGAVRNEEIMLKRKDGTPFIGSVTAVAIKNGVGEIKYYDGIIEDITELKQAKEDAQKRWEEMVHLGRVATMGELSASLAHELNQPLTAIMANAQTALRLLVGNRPDLNEINEILADIVSDDRRAGQIIKRLRSLFKKGELEKTELDMNDLIQGVVSLIKSEAIIRNLHIETILNNSLPDVIGDRVHLQQLMINFILNASEAMANVNGSHRKIIISTIKDNELMIKVAVRDYGVGIAKENFDQIIEPFFTTKSGGMGMGLSINRSIIEAHGGRFWAENNPDKGTTFYFTLPICKEGK